MPIGHENYNETDEKENPQEAKPAAKRAASVLLKLFISGYERCHTTDAP